MGIASGIIAIIGTILSIIDKKIANKYRDEYKEIVTLHNAAINVPPDQLDMNVVDQLRLRFEALVDALDFDLKMVPK